MPTQREFRFAKQKYRESKASYLVDIVQSVIRHLVPVEAGVVSALPRYQHGEGLNVLNCEFQDQRSGTEGVGVKIEEDEASELGRLLASQQTALDVTDSDTISSAATATADPAHQFLMISQPFPQLLRLAATM